MEYFLQQVINGLTLGAIYGLIAIGYTMVYGIIGMINFAHGDIFMIGAFISLMGFLLLGLLGVGWLPLTLLIVLIASMMLTAAYGWTVERLAYRPLRGSFRLAPLISAIGMSLFLQNYVQLLQGARAKPLPPVIEGGFELMRRPDGFTATISYLQILIIVLTVVLMIAFTLADPADLARPPATLVRAGQDHGLAAGRECRPHDFHDLRHGRRLGRGRRPRSI